MKLREAKDVGQAVGAPYAPQLGIARVQIASTALAAQRSGSARAASSGLTTLPSPCMAGGLVFFLFSFFFFFFCAASTALSSTLAMPNCDEAFLLSDPRTLLLLIPYKE
jgi:hypothetical protein